MFDAHAHLDSVPDFNSSGGIAGWILPGVSAARDANSQRLAVSDPRLHVAAGLHPWYLPAASDLEQELAALQARVDEGGILAIGETGLDKGRRAGPRDLQRVAFRAQLQMASRTRLPLILHVVRSHGACLDEIAKVSGDLFGMVHDFQGPVETIDSWVAAGFMLSVSPRAQEKEKMIQSIPAQFLLLETDDEGWRKLPALCATVAHIRGVEPVDLGMRTESNARRLFGLSPTP